MTLFSQKVFDTYETETGEAVNRQIRPTRVAIVHGTSIAGSAVPQDEIHDALTALFSPLNVRVFSVLELSEAGMSDLLSSQAYDVIGLIGEADEFALAKKPNKLGFRQHGDTSEDESIVLSFATKTRFKDARRYLNVSDAVVLCEVIGRNWILEVSQIVYHFFESLVIPSLLNIDLADVKRIAKGIGLAFNLSDDDHRKIITKLPKECLVARSAVLHFSCKDDVRLREIYSISKSITLKEGLANPDLRIDSHSDVRKVIRKVNVKMGIRIIGDSTEKEDSVQSNTDSQDTFRDEKRISMTAILFGI